MKLLLVLVPGGCLVLAGLWVWRARRHAPLTLSQAWCAAHAQREDRAGAPWVGVSWKRPRCPIRDNNGIWNRHVERARKTA